MLKSAVISQVNLFLKKRGLNPQTPVEKFLGFNGPIYKTLCARDTGERLFLKAGLAGEDNDSAKLKREILFWQAVEKIDFANWLKNREIGLVTYVDSSLSDPFPWLLLEECQAKVTGNWFAFKRDFLTRKNLAALTYYFPFMQFLYQGMKKAKSFDFSILPRRDGHWFLESLAGKRKVSEAILGKRIYNLIFEEVGEAKQLLDQSCQFLLHRDSHPENILLSKGDRLFLVDFNDICFGNEAYEFAHLWVHAWKKPSWQKAFLEEYLRKISNKKSFLILFRLCLFDLLTSEIENLRNRSLVSFRIPEEEIDSFQKTAIASHAKSLRLALESKLL